MAVAITPAYEVVALKPEDGMAVLRNMFPSGSADERNFVLFSTSGIHGSYSSIEDVAASLETDEPERLTVLVIQPRTVRMLYGAIDIAAADVPFLLNLRASSKAVIGTL
jgi:hypothetical protein